MRVTQRGSRNGNTVSKTDSTSVATTGSKTVAPVPGPATQVAVPGPVVAGEFIDACGIDLPKNDVIESIDFERFFRLNLQFHDLQGPAALPLHAMAAKRAPSNEHASAPQFASVPFSTDKTAWKALNGNTPHALGKARAKDHISPQVNLPTIDISSLPLALYLPFRQEWSLLGYSRGRLVNSFTLGPQEEQTIEIFKWDRLTESTESTSTSESDQTNESSSTRRDTNDVAQDISRQTGFEVNSQGKVGFTVGVVNADLSAGFNARTGVNDVEKATRSAIMDATSRSTSRIRTSRTLKVVESRESGQETRITRHLRNANNCHTLTIAFLEILANYRVSTFVRADAVQLVVLINSTDLGSLTSFNRQTLRAHETALRLALLDSTLLDGFPAARFLDARDRACAILCQGCTCGDAVSAETSSAQWTNLTAAADTLGQVVTMLRGLTVLFPASIPGALIALPPAVTDIKRHLFFKSLETQAPRLLTDLAALGLGGGAATVTTTQADGAAQLLAAIPADALAKLTSDSNVSQGVYWEIFAFIFGFVTHEPLSAIASTEVVSSNTGRLANFDDGGLVGAITVFNAAYANWRTFQQAQIDADEKAAALQKIEDEERELRVLEAYPLRETADALERLDALLSHLNDPRNLDHYRFAVWNERSGATDSTLIGLALAGLIDPTPVGMVGDQLAVPVRMVPGSELAEFFADSIVDLLDVIERDDQEQILPTPALYAESIVGTCGACESTIGHATRLDLNRQELDNKLLELEVERLRGRLAAHPPLLDRELDAPPAIRVDVTNDGTTP